MSPELLLPCMYVGGMCVSIQKWW